jgi:glycosyltransferase involved in cell wall biosynthesis
MPKVLRIINRFNLGGPTFNVAYLTKYLPADYETLLVGGEKEASEDSSEFILDSLGIKPVIIPEIKRALSPINDYKAFRKIDKLIKDYKPDIVHTHASKAGTVGRLAAIANKVPIIVHTFHGHVFHSYFGKAQTLFYKKIERFLAQKSDAIIALSEKQKNELVTEHEICEENKTRVIPLGFDLARFRDNTDDKRIKFRNRYSIPESCLAISIIGRLVPIKNHRFFLRVIKKLFNNCNSSVKIFIVGDGEEKENLMNYCNELGLGDEIGNRLVFTSWIKEVDEVLAGSDIVCLTSLNEGTPVSLIEAQAAGKPIVSTKVGGIENVVSPNAALLTDVTNENSFYNNLKELVENESLRKRMSEAGWSFVKEKFHYSRLVSDMDKLYRELLSKA